MGIDPPHRELLAPSIGQGFDHVGQSKATHRFTQPSRDLGHMIGVGEVRGRLDDGRPIRAGSELLKTATAHVG